MANHFAQVLSTGTYASIQDKGRNGYQHLGLPQSGWLQSSKAEMANSILENNDNCAVIECFGRGFSMRFSQRTFICIVGLDFTIVLNDEQKYNETQVIEIVKGDVLKVEKNKIGLLYIAIHGGWQTEVKLSSRSMMKGVTSQSIILKEMLLPFPPLDLHVALPQSRFSIKKNGRSSAQFYLTPGPELLKYGLTYFKKPIQLSLSPSTNRQAICFNEKIEGNFPEIASSYTPVGTVQVTSGGNVYILSKDGQTTGGYFRLGFVDLDVMEQIYDLRSGQEVRVEVNPN